MTGDYDMELLVNLHNTDDISFMGALFCPNCAARLIDIGVEGTITSFEAACNDCEVALFSYAVVAVPDAARMEDGDPTAEQLKAFIIEEWEANLADGIEEEFPVGPEPDSVRVKDTTRLHAHSYATAARDFGWEWRPADYDFDFNTDTGPEDDD